MNINLVYDFESVNGYMCNSIDPLFYKKLYTNSFKCTKYVIDSIGSIDDMEFHSNEFNLNYFDNNISISSLTESILNQKDIFVYPLASNGKNHFSFGVDSNYKNSSIIDLISEKAKYLLKNYKNFKVLIYVGLEHEMPIEYFKQIYITLQNNNINPNKIWIVSNNFKNKDNNIKFLQKFGMSIDIQLNFLVFYEQLKTKGNEVIDNINNNLLLSDKDEIKIKSNKCLMLNRRLHWHRKMFLSLLQDDGLLDNNLISFNFDFENTKFTKFETGILNDNYLKVDMFFSKDDFNINVLSNSLKNKILNGYSKLKKIKKQVLDVSDLSLIDGRRLELDNVELYKNSYFSIVSETEFFENWNNYTTEKILKPIQQLHPFILVGRPHSLKYLKLYGFKTFSDFWDESYDDEFINPKRMEMIYSLFVKLNNKSDDEWVILLKSIKDILIYNRNVLKQYAGINNDTLIRDNFKKYLSNEHHNENPKLLQT